MPAFGKGIAAFLLLCTSLFAADLGGVWLDVPFVKQEKDGCGSASVAMVMQYWAKQKGTAVSEAADAAQIQRVLYSKKAHGIYASDLERYFQQQRFRTFVFRGSWQDLEQHLERGRPLLVALKTGSLSDHYVVVVGIDSLRNVIMINDPARRKMLKYDRASFEKEWNERRNWTLLAVPE